MTNASDCLFCQIAMKAIPATILYEDALTLAFNDIHPKAPIHVLIIPKRHIGSFLDVPKHEDKIKIALFDSLQTVIQDCKLDISGCRIVTNIGEDGGQTVGHLHLHLLGGRALAWPPG